MKRTERKWMWKRALSMLLVCVMLFSNVDLTALAVEIDEGMGMTTQGQEGGTENGSVVADETNQPEEPDVAEEKNEEKESEKETDDGKNPGDETDAGDVTDDSGEGDDTEDEENQDSDQTGEDDESGLDQPDKPDDNTADEEKNDEIQDTEESVSGNSVSENSVAAFVRQKDLSVEAVNGLGSLLLGDVQIAVGEEQSAEQATFDISEITVKGSTANVRLCAVENCTVVVSIYEENSEQPFAFGHEYVEVGEDSVDVKIEADTMPEYFIVKGHLVDTDSLRPLSREYKTSMYTKVMQDFLKMTTDDFDASKVVNLDEDATTNFVVVKDGNALIRAKEEKGNVINDLVSYDEETHTYLFANVDETLANLKEEDIFVYQKAENDILIVKVKSVVYQESEEGGNTVTVIAYRDELNVDDVFSYVKIEESTGTVDASEIDPDICPEGVIYRGRNTAVGYAIEGEPTVKIEASTDEFELDLAKVKEESSLGPITIKKEGKVSVNFGVTIKLHYYFGWGVWDVDLSMTGETKISGNMSVEGKLSVPLIKTPVESLKGLFIVKYTPEFVMDLSYTGTVEAGVSFTFGIRFGNLDSENNGSRGIHKITIGKFEGKIDGYIGVDFDPSLCVIDILNAELETGIHIGIEASISGSNDVTITESYVEHHECGSECVSGNGYFDVPMGGELHVLKCKDYKLADKLDLKPGGSLIKEPFADFYYSIKYKEFGWGECPHKNVKSNVRVIDFDGNGVEGVTVRSSLGESKKKTDKWGFTELIYCEGKQNIYVEQDFEGRKIRYSQEVQVPEDIDSGVLTIEIKSATPLAKSTTAKNVYITSYRQKVGGVCYAAIMEDGSLYMWGDNDWGQLGIGSTDSREQPVKILENVKEFQFSQNGLTCAAITTNRELYLWGSNIYGIAGNGNYLEYWETPFHVLIGEKISKFIFSPDNDNSAAITTDGKLYLWGSNQLHQISKEDMEIFRMPQLIMENVADFVMENDTCAAITTLADGRKLYLWGHNIGGVAGQEDTIGNHTGNLTVSPDMAVQEAFLENVDQVTIYSKYNKSVGAAVTKSGDLYMWGNGYSEKIFPDEGDSYWISKKEVDCEGKAVKEFVIGALDSKAVTEDGTLYNWKVNSDISGSVKKEPTLMKVTKLMEGVKAVYEEAGTSAVITKENQMFMSGENEAYQLGDGTQNPSDDWKSVLSGMEVEDFEFLDDGKVCAAFVKNGSSKDLWTWGSYAGSQTAADFSPNNYSAVPEIKGEDVERIISYPSSWFRNGTADHININFAVLYKDGSLREWFGGSDIKREGLENLKDIESADRTINTVVSSIWVWMIGCGNDGEVYTWYSDSSSVGDKKYFFGDKKIFPDAASVASEYSLMDITDEMSVQSSGPEEELMSTHTEASSKQTADFINLQPNGLYNIYAMKSREAENCLSSDNLLYIGQATSDVDGNLNVSFEMKEAYASPVIFCVGFKQTDLAEAEITVPDIVYDGNRHIPEVTVTYNGQVLRRGVDYRAYLYASVEEVGEYELTVKGIGLYCGEKKAIFHVIQGNTSGEDDDPDVPAPDPIYGEVLKEDIPADGIIPEGLWIAGVSEAGYDYTGKAIKPEARVYDHKTRLMEKTDYTIAYKNNIMAYSYSASDQEFAANKAPTITVTGKGNYTGKETQTFQILPLDISVGADASGGTGTEAAVQSGSSAFAADNMTITANNKNQKPVPALMWNDKKLKNNTDYTVTYYDSTGVKKLDYVKEAGNYYIELTGKGNFTGTRRVNLTVIGLTDQWKLMSKVTVAKIPNQPYTGSAIEPMLTVKDGKTTLNKDEHYTVSYSCNTEIGTAYAIVTGIEAKGYSGTKRVSFKITGGSVSRATVTGLTGQSFVYGGVNKEPELTVSVKVAGVEKTLKKGDDYKVTWQKNRDAGTATAIITGVGGYTGTLKKTFKIQAFDIAVNTGGRFTAVLTQNEVPYAKGGTKPEVAVTFLRDNGTAQKLQEGKDYTLSYKNHTTLNDGSRADKLPTVIIKGKGNFKGTYSTKLTYKITTQDLGNLTLTAADKTYQNKKNIFAAKVTITDLNDKVLKAGTDYDKTFTYTYKNQTTLDNGTVRAAGAAVDKNDIIPAGTVLEVTVSAKGNYTGTKTGEYRIAQVSISTASVSIPKQTYTGQVITLDKDEITVKIKGKPVDASQYEIVPGSYKNNVKKGTASVTIKGVDNYGGTKTVKFTIRAKGFLWWWRKG